MGSIDLRPNGRYRARWRELDGTQRARHFATEAEAERYLVMVEADLIRGTYLSPAGGRTLFGEFAEAWRLAQVHERSTAERTETLIRRHMGVWADRQLGSIRPTEVQAWVRSLSIDQEERKGLAPRTVASVAHLFATIMRAAVLDRLIPESPVQRLKLPKVERSPVVPLASGMVLELAGVIRPELRAAVLVSALAGLRVSEVTGLTVDRVAFLRRELTVDRQIAWVTGEGWVLKGPKTAASRRTVPIPERLTTAVAAHLEVHGEGPERLIFHAGGVPFRRRRVGEALAAAVKAVGAPSGTTWHDFRHFYASALIGAGASVKVVQARLGHATAGETLDTYAHLWPADEDRTRDAMESVFARVGAGDAADRWGSCTDAR